MQPNFDVLSYGTIGIDVVLRVPHLPAPDRPTHAFSETVFPGGNATNTAVHLAVWGVRVAISGTAIGDDWAGQQLLEFLARYPNISTRYLRREPGLRSVFCRVLVTPDGERAIIGVNVGDNPQTPPVAEMIADARVLALDLRGGPERVEAARLATKAGLPVVVGDVRRSDHPVLSCTTVAIASAAEIRRQYPGVPLETFARAVQAAGAQQVIITDGPADLLGFDAEGARFTITPPRVPVVDTTGAGDAFRAGVVYGILSGWPLIECAALGAAAGSLNVGRVGASSDPVPLDELLALARSLARCIG